MMESMRHLGLWRRFGLFLPGLFLLLWGPTIAQAQSVSPVQLLSQGIAAVQKKDYEAGRKTLQKLVQADRENSAGYYYLAVCEAHLADYENAARHLDDAIANGLDIASRLLEDPYLQEPLKAPAFRKGVERILHRLAVREKGEVVDLEFEFALQDWQGNLVSSTDYKGQCLAILFLDTQSASCLEAALILEELIVAEESKNKAVAICRLYGKTLEDQVNELESYGSSTRIQLPLLVREIGIEKQLRPFRRYPTVLFLDPDGTPRRIIEGHGANARELYVSAFKEARAAAAKSKNPKSQPASKPKSKS